MINEIIAHINWIEIQWMYALNVISIETFTKPVKWVYGNEIIPYLSFMNIRNIKLNRLSKLTFK